MSRRAANVLLGLVLCFLPCGLSDADVTTKANLDLPYNAFGVSEEEELAPEVIYFFGQSYESDAIVFALDESGSMNDNNRWTMQTREVVRAMTQLSEVAEFGLVYYSSGVKTFRNTPVSATSDNTGSAVAFINSRRPAGDTCLFEGLERALQIVNRSTAKRRAVVVTSDGMPDFCQTGHRLTEGQMEAALARSLALNAGVKATVHTIWVGAGTDRMAIQFMQRLARAHGGTFKLVNQ